MPSEKLWQQYRSVEAGDVQAVAQGNDDDLDIEISIGFSKNDDGLSFDVTIWNLKYGTWAGVEKGDPCRVQLGWVGGGPSPQPVCIGRINEKYTNTEGPDKKYVLKGQDQSTDRLNIEISDAWRDQPPDAIARDIAGQVGLGIGRVESVGGAIDGIWSIKKDHPAKHWLGELVSEAEKISGEKWEYRAEFGKFYFMKKETDVGNAINVNSGNALKVDRASGQTEKTDGGNEIEFEAYLDPRLKKDSILNVDSADFSGLYKISSYDFTSSTTNGDHMMSGTAAPTDAYYKKTFPGSLNSLETGFRR